MKHSLKISKADFEQARYKKDTSSHKKIRQRMQMITLLYKDYKQTEIAGILDVTEVTIWRWKKLYRQGSIDALCELHYQGQKSELHEYSELIQKSIDEVNPSTREEIQDLVEKKTGIRRSLTQIGEFVGNHLKIKRRKVQPLPGGKKTMEELIKLQEAFSGNTLYPLINKALSDEITLLFCDAVHPTHGFHQGYVYSSKPHFVRTGHGRYRFNMYSAVDAKTKDLFTIHGGKYVNADTVIELLDFLKEHYPEKPLYLIMDNARYQHCNFVKQEAKERSINLEFLPPYSPNLNLIERLWKFMKKQVLSAKCYACRDDFEQAFIDFLDKLERGEYSEKINSLLTLNFQTFKTLHFNPT